MFCQRLNVVHPPIRNVNFGWRCASQWLTNENPAKSLEPYLQVRIIFNMRRSNTLSDYKLLTFIFNQSDSF